jgi:hypothetical protein
MAVMDSLTSTYRLSSLAQTFVTTLGGYEGNKLARRLLNELFRFPRYFGGLWQSCLHTSADIRNRKKPGLRRTISEGLVTAASSAKNPPSKKRNCFRITAWTFQVAKSCLPFVFLAVA